MHCGLLVGAACVDLARAARQLLLPLLCLLGVDHMLLPHLRSLRRQL